MQRSSLSASEIDGGVHVASVASAWIGVAAHVQGRLGLLSQLLHRQYAMHVDDLLEVPHDALELLLHVTAQ